MDATKRKHIINGSLAFIWLVLWLLFCRSTFTGSSASSSRSLTEYGITREVVTHDPNPLKREYTLLLIAGVYGAVVASAMVYRRRYKSEQVLYVLAVAPIITTLSGILLLMLATALFYPGDPAVHGNEVSRRLLPALGVGVYGTIGLSGFIIIPAILGGLTTSSFLKAFSSDIVTPPPLPGQR